VAKTRKFMNAGSFCLVTGGILTLFGTVRLVAFLNRVQAYKSLTAAQLFQELVLPHIVLLIGIGLVTAAFILFTRGAIIRKRQGHDVP